MSKKFEQMAFNDGQQHFREGVHRKANPYLMAAFNDGARKPQNRPAVRLWFAGWDLARIQAGAKAGAKVGGV